MKKKVINKIQKTTPIKKTNSKKKTPKNVEELFTGLNFSCDCSSCPKKCS